MATETARRYALIRLGAGSYLLPGNDGETLFHIYSYQDEWQWPDEERVRKAKVWQVDQYVGPLSLCAAIEEIGDGWDDEDFDWHKTFVNNDWDMVWSVAPTRKAAIDCALGIKEADVGDQG